MLQTFQIAKLIEKELNEDLNAIATKTKVKIHNVMGNYQKAIARADGTKQRVINGILRSTTGNYTPVKSLNNLMTTLMLEFAVSENDVETIQLILDHWTELTIGNVYGLTKDVQMLITPQPASPGQAKNAAPLGSMVPISVVLDIQLIKGGLISNAVNWKINSNMVAPTNASMSFNRNPDVVPKANKNACKANNQYEVQSVVLVLPLSFNNINKKIVQDIFSANKDEIYTIERNDDFFGTFTADMIITNADYAEESGKIVALTLTFAPADDEEDE